MERADLNFGAATLTVAGAVDAATVRRVAAREGIGAQPARDAAPARRNPWREPARWRTVAAGLGVLVAEALRWTGGPEGAAILAAAVAIVVGGYATARKALHALPRGRFDMNVLMTVAVLGAIALGDWAEGAMVAFLFDLANTLEAGTMDRARRSLRGLLDLAPRRATVRRGGAETEVAPDEVAPGETLLVRPGERIALDGRIVAGRSAIDQAPITGESLPVERGPGDEVYGGTVNGAGALEIAVTRPADDTTLARIIRLVEEASASRAPAQRFVERFAAVYTPAVLALAAGLALLPPLLPGQEWRPWVYRALALLVVSCPCALVISTPVAIVAAVGTAARRGVLFKGGLHLEQLGRVVAVAFDKTGTLTRGEPSVVEVRNAERGTRNRDEDNPEAASEPYSAFRVPRSALVLAAAVEQRSEHPLAAAVVRRAREEGLALPEVAGFTALPGLGARGVVEGREVYVGSPRLFAERGIALGEMTPVVEQLREAGQTVLLVGDTARGAIGAIGVADAPRPEAADTVAALRAAGVRRTVLLTGDSRRVAAAIAAHAGVDEVRAELLPAEKVAAVRETRAAHGPTAMVGDGINDAPALAAATVGVAMGGVGSDAALEAADVVLMRDDLTRLPYAVRLGHATLRIIKQNIALSLVIKFAAVVLVFPGWLTLWLAVLADMGTTLLVTANALRLTRSGK